MHLTHTRLPASAPLPHQQKCRQTTRHSPHRPPLLKPPSVLSTRLTTQPALAVAVPQPVQLSPPSSGAPTLPGTTEDSTVPVQPKRPNRVFKAAYEGGFLSRGDDDALIAVPETREEALVLLEKLQQVIPNVYTRVPGPNLQLESDFKNLCNTTHYKNDAMSAPYAVIIEVNAMFLHKLQMHTAKIDQARHPME